MVFRINSDLIRTGDAILSFLSSSPASTFQGDVRYSVQTRGSTADGFLLENVLKLAVDEKCSCSPF